MEAELKRDLVLCIETGDEFLAVQENELKRLRREHLSNDTTLEGIANELKEMKMT